MHLASSVDDVVRVPPRVLRRLYRVVGGRRIEDGMQAWRHTPLGLRPGAGREVEGHAPRLGLGDQAWVNNAPGGGDIRLPAAARQADRKKEEDWHRTLRRSCHTSFTPPR